MYRTARLKGIPKSRRRCVSLSPNYVILHECPLWRRTVRNQLDLHSIWYLILGQSLQPRRREGRMAIWLPTNPSATLYPGNGGFSSMEGNREKWEKIERNGRAPIKCRERDQVSLLIWHLQILGSKADRLLSCGHISFPFYESSRMSWTS